MPKKFSELNLPKSNHLIGSKIEIMNVLNREITILGFQVQKSKYSKNKSGDCLYLQVEFDGNKHVIFTGSDVLLDQIKMVPETEFPFTTVIMKPQKYFEFT